MDTYIACILLWPCNFAPKNWAYCAGQILSISQNTALFSLLGTTYGGNGQTTFALPDFRSRVPVGAGQGPGLSNYVIGEASGSENVTLITTQIPSHTHALSLTLNIQANNTNGTVSNPTASINTLASAYDASNDNPIQGYNNLAPNTTLNVGSSPISGTAGLTGGSQPHSNMQPYLCVNYIIALYGIFPTRN